MVAVRLFAFFLCGFGGSKEGRAKIDKSHTPLVHHTSHAIIRSCNSVGCSIIHIIHTQRQLQQQQQQQC